MFNPFPIKVTLPKTYPLNSELKSEKLVNNLADKLEYQIFSFMLVKKIYVVYTYSELEKSDDMVRNIIKISDSRPEGKECTERNFENLVKMSNEDFEKLVKPYYSKNLDIVVAWRDTMRKELGVS